MMFRYLSVAILTTLISQGCNLSNTEPRCSQFDFQERLLEKTVRMEHSLEVLKADLENARSEKTTMKGSEVMVAFFASLDDALETETHTPVNVIFDRVITNAGRGYNVKDGVFIAPVHGFYSITAATASDKDSRLFIMMNGKVIQYVISAGEWNSDSKTAVLELQVGDRVWIEGLGKIYGDGTCYYTRAVSPVYICIHTTFSVFLIGRN